MTWREVTRTSEGPGPTTGSTTAEKSIARDRVLISPGVDWGENSEVELLAKILAGPVL